jgi:2-polyprenyl-6-methoxyphenol hydroxylase-like FAD-dependent oxidoreductase
MKTAETLVVGGGPVGLFAALCLHERGVQVRVSDAQWRRPVRGYACGLHAATLAAFNEVGLLPQLLQVGHHIERIAIYRATERETANLDAIGGSSPHVLTLRQSDLEDILVDALERRHVPISWCHEVTQLTLGDGVVRITEQHRRQPTGIESAPPTERRAVLGDTRQADYVIGADGYHSACRRALGIELVGSRPPEVFAVCEFLADLSGWTFQVQDHFDEAPSLATLRHWIRERAPWFEPIPRQLCWGALADFPQRVARRFGSGRIWLAGDAAHCTSPLGFQGLNRGLCEAGELATIIADTGHGTSRRVRPFELFELEQQREWKRLIEAPVIGSADLSNEDGSRLVPCLPASGGDLDTLMAQLGLRFA